MRKFGTWLGAACWLALATLMPMAALEPIGSSPVATAPAHGIHV
jgi:hypothetical protein